MKNIMVFFVSLVFMGPLQLSAETPEENSIFNLDTTWTSQNKKKLQLKDLKGKTLVVTLIYASCPHVCPLTISDVIKIRDGLDAKTRAKTAFVLVTIDPKGDSPAVLQKLAEKRKITDWYLLNGGPDGVLELAMVLGVKYKATKDGQFSHSNIITIVDSAGVISYQQKGLNQDPAKSIDVISTLAK